MLAPHAAVCVRQAIPSLNMKILPLPQKFENISGSFRIDGNAKMFCDSAFIGQAERLADLVYASCGFFLQFTDVIEEARIIFAKDAGLSAEGYVIMISQGVVTITAADEGGCFYAVESLRQMFDLDVKQEFISCSDCYVEDSPRFAYRGIMLDVARHFFGVDAIKKLIALMSQVKLNVLHLHLTDDQGFRLQIDKYPLLTEIASVRDGSEVRKNGESYINDVPHAGFLTKDDVRELVTFAAAHNVEIVPEIDLPGHFAAALAAYPELSCTGSVTEVRKKWSASKNILCAGNDETYRFVKDILDEVCELFPSQYVHLGGEQVAKDRWCNCKLCRERMSQLKTDSLDELQTYMIEVFRTHLEAKGKTVIIRNDGLTKGTHSDVVVQSWTPVKGRAARKNCRSRRTIISPRRKLHFSHDYNDIPVKRILALDPYRGIRKSDRDKVLGVEGAIWTQDVEDEDVLFYLLLPRLDALAECCWNKKHKDFYSRLQPRLAYYESVGLNYNRKFARKTAEANREDAQQGDTL